jgi:hypothetical protein
MASPNDPSVRQPAVAGRFYPAEAGQCRAQAQAFLRPNAAAVAEKRWGGGIVPHAGWICSGAVAGETIATLAAQGPADVVVIFGAIHTPLPVQSAALDSHQRWALPGGDSQISMDLQHRLQQQGNLFIVDERLHSMEHAVEVVVPMIQLAFANTPILPIEVPALEVAALIGRKAAQAIAETGVRAVYLASTDFTHYGTNYRFMPAGVGPAAMQWAKENDRPLLQLIAELAEDKIVAEVRQRGNACGAGAVAAMLAACKEMGATSGRVLRHTTSFETLAKVAPQPPTNAVGYAAVVVG